MKSGIDSQKAKTLNYLILGLGKTGVSMVTFCVKEGLNFIAADSRETTPGMKLLQNKYPNIKIYPGSFSDLKLEGIDIILKSPGINLHDPIIQRAMELGIHILTEIDLFFSKARAPVVAITGSNGKSTVTTLVGLVAESEGLNVGVGGNLGTPMLELINSSRDLYVLELSSYQLELVDDMRGAISCILNITPDHIDRHKTMQNYIASKSNILKGASITLLNKDDPVVSSIKINAEKKYFSLSDVNKNLSSMDAKNSNCHISFEDGSSVILDDMILNGDHNLSNILAALKLCKLAGLSNESMHRTISAFRGLPHRCEKFLLDKNIEFINDSKSTNVASTKAAIEAHIEGNGKSIILLLGGLDKGQDFSPLNDILDLAVKKILLFVKNAGSIKAQLSQSLSCEIFDSLKQATIKSYDLASSGDKVLLSPGCSSFDEFSNYEHRGNFFKDLIFNFSNKDSQKKVS